MTDQEDGDGADEDGGQVVFSTDGLAGSRQPGVPTNKVKKYFNSSGVIIIVV